MIVCISQTAQEQIDRICEYLEKTWSLGVRDNFIQKLVKNRQLMAQRPLSFPESKNLPGLRKCVITPRSIAYYRIDEAKKIIEIIAVIDSRQDF